MESLPHGCFGWANAHRYYIIAQNTTFFNAVQNIDVLMFHGNCADGICTITMEIDVDFISQNCATGCCTNSLDLVSVISLFFAGV